ncbi:MAG: glucose-1-phosphate adenylyltransferase [Opitutales bacterium]
MDKVVSIIMGGGRGTRLYPLTKYRCKPAVPLAGKYRLVDIPISNCINSGCNHIYLLSQFNTASLHKHIQQSYKFDSFGGGFVDILAAEQTERGENWYQGTADAVRQNMHHFGHNGEGDYFLILSGDQLYQMDFSELIAQHKASGADVTIASKPVPKALAPELGIMQVDNSCEITRFAEKVQDEDLINSFLISDELKQGLEDKSQDYCLASMGIYVFSYDVMIEAMSGSEMDFGKEIIPNMLGKKKLCSYIFDGYWEDIGTIKAFFDTNLSLAEENPPFDFYNPKSIIYSRSRFLPAAKIFGSTVSDSLISDGCVIKKAMLSRTVMGVRSMIGEGSMLSSVISMGADFYESPESIAANNAKGIPCVGVGKNCVINNAIIDKNARIGNNVKLSPEAKQEGWECGEVYVRDGIIIVNKDAIIPDNTIY